MSQTQLHFGINQPHVVAENFGDEVVAINLESGNYYSIDKAGVAIWELASTGATVDDILACVSQRYEGDFRDIQLAIQQFMVELQRAELIVTHVNSVHAAQASLPEQPVTEKLPFEAPTLHEYTDMQELLLLDPIHEVTAAGWPIQK